MGFTKTPDVQVTLQSTNLFQPIQHPNLQFQTYWNKTWTKTTHVVISHPLSDSSLVYYAEKLYCLELNKLGNGKRMKCPEIRFDMGKQWLDVYVVYIS